MMSTVIYDIPYESVKVFYFSRFSNDPVKNKYETSAEAHVGEPHASKRPGPYNSQMKRDLKKGHT